MSDQVTVLRDETLGVVEREYREVKRRAALGEWIKIVSGPRQYPVGAIGKCTRNGEFSDDSIDTTLSFEGSEGDGFIDAEVATYAVLEPTDIVRINGERLRMVKRKADVGERIIVFNRGTSGHRRGDVLFITEVNERNTAQTRKAGDIECGWLYDHEYRVLEPVETARSAESTRQTALLADIERKTDALAAQVDGLTDTVAKLTTAMQRMNIQLRVAREDIVLIEEGVSEDIAELRTRVAELERKEPARALPVKDPLTREAIIERAKRDVAELLSLNHPGTGGEGAWFTDSDGSVITDRCEFIINRDKRTVLALLRYVRGNRVWARGIAKCAPGDVFNSHIGRAIALRRALGLAVPDEYINAPAPESVRVGDYVYYMSTFPRVLVTERVTNFSANPPRVNIDFIRTTATETSPNPVIDDSREEVAE